jgi:mono/diheme cytochrome c family protein
VPFPSRARGDRPPRPHTVRIVLATLGALALFFIVAGSAFVYFGVYNVAATEQHTRPVYWLLDVSLRRAIAMRSRDIAVPPLSDPGLLRLGAIRYQDACVQCHGAPGTARGAEGMSMLPVPNDLVQAAREWPPAELYWVIRHGIKMTGMPAWEFRFSERELWAVVAFLKHLPQLSVQDYEAWQQSAAEAEPGPQEGEPPPEQGDPRRGITALRQYACTSCHRIPGMVGPDAHTGPPLERVGSRKYLAGRLPNSPENLILWIQRPQEVSATTLMPEQGVSDRDARDMAAYLMSLK